MSNFAGRMFFGSLSDRLGRYVTLLLAMAVNIGAMLLLSRMTEPTSSIVTLAFVGACGGAHALYFKCDATVEAEVQALVDFAVEKFGSLDVMVANSGAARAVTIDKEDMRAGATSSTRTWTACSSPIEPRYCSSASRGRAGPLSTSPPSRESAA